MRKTPLFGSLFFVSMLILAWQIWGYFEDRDLERDFIKETGMSWAQYESKYTQ